MHFVLLLLSLPSMLFEILNSYCCLFSLKVASNVLLLMVSSFFIYIFLFSFWVVVCGCMWYLGCSNQHMEVPDANACDTAHEDHES